MINQNLFTSSNNQVVKNEAGGDAYKMTPQHSLLQYAFTGTFSNTFYMSAQAQLDTVLELCDQCDNKFIAKVAVASRKSGYMKDMPAMLAAYLNAHDPDILARIFNRVIDNGKMLRKFVQIVRSGVTGRRGFGSKTRNTIRNWFANRTDVQLMYDNIGGKDGVSLEHILRMVRPKPENRTRSAIYSWIRGAKFDGDKLVQPVRYRVGGNRQNPVFEDGQYTYDLSELPNRLQDWELYKRNPADFDEPPKIPFEMIVGAPNLSVKNWESIAKNMSWQQLRQSLEMLNRHGVFDNPRMVEYACDKLRSTEDIAKSRCFPYQILATYLNSGPTPEGFGYSSAYWNSVSLLDKGSKPSDVASLPKVIRHALEDAMEVAIKNVPVIRGQVYVCPDTSGSMGDPITGKQYGSAPKSKVRCVDVAGLITAAVLRKNPSAKALPFNTQVHDIELNPMSTVMRNAAKFASLGGGGTACSAPIALLNKLSSEGDVIILISDYESWSGALYAKGVATMNEWNRFKNRNPTAKLICIDLTPRTNHQVCPHYDILQIGGFSDQVFNIMQQFVDNKLGYKSWLNLVEEIEI